MLSHLFFLGHTVPADSQERGTGQKTLTTASSADCSTLSPAAPIAIPPPNPWCRVHPKCHFLRPLGEEGLEALLWIAVCFKRPPWPRRTHRQLPGCNAFIFHVTFPFPDVAKQNPSVPHCGRWHCQMLQPLSSFSPNQRSLGTGGKPLSQVWGLSSSLTCATTSSRKP